MKRSVIFAAALLTAACGKAVVEEKKAEENKAAEAPKPAEYFHVDAATAGGVMSKTGNLGGTGDVIAGLTALGLGLICAFCGARLAYLNAEQV